MPRKPKEEGPHYNDPFPTALRNLMDSRKTKQKDLTPILGLTARQGITGYRDGSTVPTIEKIVALADHYKVSTDYLLGRTKVEAVKPDLRQACEYTGLDEETVEALHIDAMIPEHHSLCARLIGDLVMKDGGIASRLSRLLSDSADAKEIARISKADSRADVLRYNSKKMQGSNLYAISPEDAAEYLLSQAEKLLTSHIRDVLLEMRDDRCSFLSDPDSTSFDWNSAHSEVDLTVLIDRYRKGEVSRTDILRLLQRYGDMTTEEANTKLNNELGEGGSDNENEESQS